MEKPLPAEQDICVRIFADYGDPDFSNTLPQPGVNGVQKRRLNDGRTWFMLRKAKTRKGYTLDRIDQRLEGGNYERTRD